MNDPTDGRADGRTDNAAGDQAEDDRPDAAHRRPPGVDDATVRALAMLTKALDTTERARGRLYDFHQLTGTADFQLGEAARLLREAGHDEQAAALERELIGRNVIPGHWSFQLIEGYNEAYYRPFTALEERIRNEIADGRTHLYEAELRHARHTSGLPD